MDYIPTEHIINPKLKRETYIELREKGHTKEHICNQYNLGKHALTSKVYVWGLSKWHPGEPIPNKPTTKQVEPESPTETEQKVSLVFEEVPVESTDHIPEVSDMVERPPHYTQGKVECIDAIESATEGLTGIHAFCVGNVIKYIWRYQHKNGVEDLRKARWYLDRIIASMEP